MVLVKVLFKTPCINIGDRQKGRLRTQNIIDSEINDLDQAFEKLESKEFKQNLKILKTLMIMVKIPIKS